LRSASSVNKLRARDLRSPIRFHVVKYTYLFGLLGLALIATGVVQGGWALLTLWLGGDFCALALAHARGTHNLFGKRPDGTLPFWSWILFLPLLGYSWLVWHALRLLIREPASNGVTDQLVIGRRLMASELQGQFDNFVDLTSEFAEPRRIRASPAYRSFPVLDGGAPAPEALRAAVQGLRPGRTFVHCAQGHGRTGLFALAMLLNSGTARDVDQGLQMLQAARPRVHLSKPQRRCIEAFVAQRRPGS
jgi:hypothetical protein